MGTIEVSQLLLLLENKYFKNILSFRFYLFSLPENACIYRHRESLTDKDYDTADR